MAFTPCLVRAEDDGRRLVRIGHPLLDAYLELVGARARPNTVLAHAYDLKVFFTVIDREPAEVVPADVLVFITEQRKPRQASNVVRIEDGEVGLSARTIKPRLATIAGLYDYLIVRGDVTANPVPRGLATRRGGQRAVRGVPLIRAPRTLPRIIDPADIDAFTRALRTQRDRATGRHGGRPAIASPRTDQYQSVTLSTRNEIRTSAPHSSRLSPRSPTETTSSALMLRRLRFASDRALLTASSELVVDRPTTSMIFTTLITAPFVRFPAKVLTNQRPARCRGTQGQESRMSSKHNGLRIPSDIENLTFP